MRQQFSKEDEAKIRESLRYDPDSGKIYWLKTNYRKTALYEAGSLEKSGYLRVHIVGKKVAAHRLAWFLYNGYWPPNDIDHINGDKLDNRFSNLRCATRSQNCMNRFDPDTKGVGYYKKTDCYRARIMSGGKSIFLGYFSNFNDAKIAYDTAAKKYHKEFTNTQRKING